ncbi:hypothetical protein AALO_G00025250 [Alosa alosa]|uniref:Uncharacterized protein n=1 Tax=Alosa alosa TaxID=278164 RepID=A0AAV6HFI0_9TELE|nr:hypothetical protein AALO_G00025250 [Alosa alosa]
MVMARLSSTPQARGRVERRSGSDKTVSADWDGKVSHSLSTDVPSVSDRTVYKQESLHTRMTSDRGRKKECTAGRKERGKKEN